MLLSLRYVDPAMGAMTYCLDESVAQKAFPGHGDLDCVILKGMLFSQVFGWLWTMQWFSSIHPVHLYRWCNIKVVFHANNGQQ